MTLLSTRFRCPICGYTPARHDYMRTYEVEALRTAEMQAHYTAHLAVQGELKIRTEGAV